MKTKSFSGAKFYQKYGIFIILIIEIIIFSVLNRRFITVDNLLAIGRQISFLGIVSVGMTMTMLTGGLDISVGAMYALTGIIAAICNVRFGLPLILIIPITIIVGAVFGTVNGIMVAKFKVPALIATLGMQTVLKGISYIFTKGVPVVVKDEVFKFMGQGYVFGVIPVTLIIMVGVFILGYWVLNKTYYGRRVYAVGGNEEAARLAGINSTALIASTYTICGALAGVTGALQAARMGSGQPAAGGDFPMDVLTAVVLGGVSVNGGKGHIVNVFFGAAIMGCLINGMYMMGLSEYWQWIIKGVVLVTVVAVSNVTSTVKVRRQKESDTQPTAA